MSLDWAEVYRSSYAELVRFLHRKVWDEERAHDLAQDAFTRALGHEPANPRAWLFRVAGNLARDEARSVIRRKRHLTLLRSEAETAVAPGPTPDEDLDERQRQERVRRALDALSDRDREVLLLWDAGLDYGDIAEQTGLARGAVGTTLSRARKRLVEAYEETEGANAAHR